ncbi:MAG: site-2 protease family protein [Candidatus Binatia bacterium]
MIGQSIRLGTLWGIAIGVHASWFLIFALVTISLLAHFAELHPHWTRAYAYTVSLSTSLFFFVSVLLHELGHSVVALRKNIPIRSITLFIFGGVAQLGKEPDRPLTELQIAIAGPLVSFALAVLFGTLGRLAVDESEGLQTLGEWLGRINLQLALFNLLPGFPLDGGRVFRAAVWNWTGNFMRATQIAGNAGRAVAFLFIFSGFGMTLGGAFVQGLWIAFLGWFLLSATESNVQSITFQQALGGLTAHDVMATDYPRVPDSLSLTQLVEDHILVTGKRCFLVTAEHDLLGLITVHQVKSVPRAAWSHTTVHQAMIPLERLRYVTPEAPLNEVLTVMDEADLGQVPVVRNGKLLGLIGRDHLLRIIRTRIEFRDEQHRSDDSNT